MDQKRRKTIALVLVVVLVPVLGILIVADIKAIKAKRRPKDRVAAAATPAAPAAAPAQAAPGVLPAPAAAAISGNPSNRSGTVDSAVQREQARIAALLPRRNPFYVSKRMVVPMAPEPDPVVPEKPPVAPVKPVTMVVNGIVSPRGGGERTAFINGRLCRVGEVVGGWTVITINASDVLLENGEKRITIGIRKQ